MVERWIERLGDWNPQLLIEAKKRLKRRNVIATVSITIGLQVLAILSGGGVALYFIWQSIVAPGLILSGTYLIASDISQEIRNNTFFFVRTSPRSSSSILLGKLLGVPLLPYLAAALALPLPLLGILHYSESIGIVFASSIGIFFSCGLFYCLALFFSLKAKRRSMPITVTIVALLFSSPLHSLAYVTGIPAALAIYLLWLYYLWKMCLRRFENPAASILTKRQSYLYIASLQFIFLVSSWIGAGYLAQIDIFPFPVVSLNVFSLAILQFCLHAKHQTYRSLTELTGRELIWSDNSPPTLAIPLNWAIAFIPWLALDFFTFRIERLPMWILVGFAAFISFTIGAVRSAVQQSSRQSGRSQAIQLPRQTSNS